MVLMQYSCLENPMDGAWWAAVHGVPKSRTRQSDFTFTFHFHALEKEMATHSSVLAHTCLHIGTNKTGIHAKENLTVWLNPSRNYLKYISLSSAWLTLKEYLGKTLKLSKSWGTERKTGHQTFFFKSKLSFLATN